MKTLKKMALFVAAIFMTAMATVCVMAPNTVYASAAGNFVESPSQKDAPQVQGDKVVVNSLKNTADLTAAQVVVLQDCYEEVTKVAERSSACTTAFTKIAEQYKDVETSELEVADVFYMQPKTNASTAAFMSVVATASADETVTVTLTTTDNFAGLLKYDGQNWVAIDDVSVSGSTVSFNPGNIENGAAFATVFYVGEGKLEKAGGLSAWAIVAIVVGSLLVIAAGVTLYIAKVEGAKKAVAVEGAEEVQVLDETEESANDEGNDNE